MKKIKFIACYFGKWPVWFDGFLLSCKHNEDIDWLFFTDCKIPKNYPSNVKFVKCSMNYLSELATKKLKFKVEIAKPYKFCDLKSAYGLVFEDYLISYDYWGHCDIDVVFGDINKFISNYVYEDYDIITSRKTNIAGHFTLFKNNAIINNIFLNLPNYEFEISQDKYSQLDEKHMGRYLKENKDRYKIYWDTWMLNFPPEVQEKRKKGPGFLSADDGPWYWNKGELFIDSEEVMYLHFMTWKNSIKNMNFAYEDDVDSFYISSTSLEHRQ